MPLLGRKKIAKQGNVSSGYTSGGHVDVFERGRLFEMEVFPYSEGLGKLFTRVSSGPRSTFCLHMHLRYSFTNSVIYRLPDVKHEKGTNA